MNSLVLRYLQLKFDNLSLSPRTHVKGEGENQLHKASPDLHRHVACTHTHINAPVHTYTNGKR